MRADGLSQRSASSDSGLVDRLRPIDRDRAQQEPLKVLRFATTSKRTQLGLEVDLKHFLKPPAKPPSPRPALQALGCREELQSLVREPRSWVSSKSSVIRFTAECCRVSLAAHWRALCEAHGVP